MPPYSYGAPQKSSLGPKIHRADTGPVPQLSALQVVHRPLEPYAGIVLPPN